MPGAFDLAFVALFAVGYLLYEHYVAWPRLRRAIAAGVPDARLRAYRWVLAVQWPLAAVVLWRWASTGRPWAALGLAPPTGRRLAASVVLVVATAVLFALQARSVARVSAERRAALRARFATVMLVLPHTPREQRWFRAVAITAGVCEEILYRGFAVWALAPWLTLWGAAAASAALFGLGHSYQGRTGAVRATVMGALLGALALVTHSIVPGILIHAIVDLGGGATGYAVLRDAGSEGTAPAQAGRGVAASGTR